MGIQAINMWTRRLRKTRRYLLYALMNQTWRSGKSSHLVRECSSHVLMTPEACLIFPQGMWCVKLKKMYHWAMGFIWDLWDVNWRNLIYWCNEESQKPTIGSSYIQAVNAIMNHGLTANAGDACSESSGGIPRMTTWMIPRTTSAQWNQPWWNKLRLSHA